MNQNEMLKKDLGHFWHPCAQMHDFEDFPPMAVESASGSYLYLKDGTKVIDGISSWWCKSLGHGNRRIRNAFVSQYDKFEHVIMANCASDIVAEYCAELAGVTPGLSRVYMCENGSVSVEVAMKMSLQYHMQTGHPERKNFISLENGYHGETILTLAVGALDIYSKPFAHLLPKFEKIGPLQYLSGTDDSAWDSVCENDWAKYEKILSENAGTLAGIVFEPVLQGAGGMLIYSPDLLKRLRKWADAHGVHLIADEIFTGFGRTGRMTASSYASVIPDFMTLSKGMTSGVVPLAAVLTNEKIYSSFYASYASGKAFMHSTTYSGYAPAAAAALEVMKIFREEKIVESVAARSSALLARMRETANAVTGALTDIRGIGFMAAAKIIDPETGKPFAKEKRAGFRFYKNAAKRGALLRPIGDTFYFLPPLNTPDGVLDELAEKASAALKATIEEIKHEK